MFVSLYERKGVNGKEGSDGREGRKERMKIYVCVCVNAY